MDEDTNQGVGKEHLEVRGDGFGGAWVGDIDSFFNPRGLAPFRFLCSGESRCSYFPRPLPSLSQHSPDSHAPDIR